MNNTVEFTTSQVSFKIKPMTIRRLTASELGEYAKIIGVKKENRRPNIGGQATYWWTCKDIEQLKNLIK